LTFSNDPDELSLPAGFEAPGTILLTGVMAAGKSTLAQAVAERLPRSVHLRGDAFRRMIVHGQSRMGFDLDGEAVRQLLLRYRIAALAAGEYLNAGFSVVYQDIILGSGFGQILDLHLAHGRPLYVYVLCPSPQAVAEREAGRAKTGYADPAEIAAFDAVLRTEMPRLGCWLDTTGLTVEESVDALFSRLPEARMGPGGASLPR
jgi:predicted kinase